jgi:hypothetical protein
MVEKVITATSPCMKFITNNIPEQLGKLDEELTEVAVAVEKYVFAGTSVIEAKYSNDSIAKTEAELSYRKTKLDLVEELLDVQTAVNTMFAIMERNWTDYESIMNDAEKKVIDKNLARGYYAEEVSK